MKGLKYIGNQVVSVCLIDGRVLGPLKNGMEISVSDEDYASIARQNVDTKEWADVVEGGK